MDPTPPTYHVWQSNLSQAFAALHKNIVSFPVVAVTNVFPGIVMEPESEFIIRSEWSDFGYQRMRCNVDTCVPLQVTLCLSRPMAPSDSPSPTTSTSLLQGPTFIFNFHFDPTKDMGCADVIEQAVKNGSIGSIDHHTQHGIQRSSFGEFVVSSGCLMSPSVQWVVHKGAYHTAVLASLVTGSPLPATEAGYCCLLRALFPRVLDLAVAFPRKTPIASSRLKKGKRPPPLAHTEEESLQEFASRFGVRSYPSCDGGPEDAKTISSCYALLVASGATSPSIGVEVYPASDSPSLPSPHPSHRPSVEPLGPSPCIVKDITMFGIQCDETPVAGNCDTEAAGNSSSSAPSPPCDPAPPYLKKNRLRTTEQAPTGLRPGEKIRLKTPT